MNAGHPMHQIGLICFPCAWQAHTRKHCRSEQPDLLQGALDVLLGLYMVWHG